MMDIYVNKLVQVWDDGGDGIVALDGITHHFGSGQLACLLGPSGCGRSTLIRVTGGFEQATSGTIRIVNSAKPAAGAARAPERSVRVCQTLNLFPWRNVIDNVAFGLDIAGLSRHARHGRGCEPNAPAELNHYEYRSRSQQRIHQNADTLAAVKKYN